MRYDLVVSGLDGVDGAVRSKVERVLRQSKCPTYGEAHSRTVALDLPDPDVARVYRALVGLPRQGPPELTDPQHGACLIGGPAIQEMSMLTQHCRDRRYLGTEGNGPSHRGPSYRSAPSHRCTKTSETMTDNEFSDRPLGSPHIGGNRTRALVQHPAEHHTKQQKDGQYDRRAADEIISSAG